MLGLYLLVLPYTYYVLHTFNFVHIIMVSFTSKVFSLLDEYFRSLKSAKSIYHSIQAIKPMSGCIAYLMIKHLSKSPTAYQAGKHNGWFWGLLSKKYLKKISILCNTSILDPPLPPLRLIFSDCRTCWYIKWRFSSNIFWTKFPKVAIVQALGP